MSVLFKEKQRFRQWWFWIFIIPLGALPLFGIYNQLILGEPWGDNPMSDFGLIVFSIFIYGTIILLYNIKLVTVINQYGIFIRFAPFRRKRIRWEQLKNVECIEYGFVGGWGIRLCTKYGTVYNVKGNQGLFLEYKSGKKKLKHNNFFNLFV